METAPKERGSFIYMTLHPEPLVPRKTVQPEPLVPRMTWQPEPEVPREEVVSWEAFSLLVEGIVMLACFACARLFECDFV